MATDPHSNPIHAPLSEEPVALRYSMDADETACEAVCRAVATVEDCSVLELAPIGEVIDTDSLDALFSPSHRDERYHLTLRYAGYEVVLHGDEITVLPVS
jgi:Halobacterial output domain 1